MQIDIRTLVFIIGITHIIQFIVFYIQFKVVRVYKGPGWWLLWSAVEVLGFFVILLRDIPAIFPLVIIIQNTAIISGTIFLYIGVMRFLNKKENLKLIISVSSIYLFGLHYFLFIHNSIQIRSIIINAMLAFVAFLTAISLFRYKFNSVRNAANFNAVVFVIHGLIFLYRTFMFISGVRVEDTLSPTLFNVIIFLDALLVGLLWTFGFVIMINQRLNSEMTEAKNHFELIFSTSPEGAVITRMEDGLIVDVNNGFTMLTGYSREESVNKTIFETNIWKNIDDRNSVISALKKNGYCYNYEAIFIRKDRSELTGLMSAKLIKLNDVQHIISITRDITELKESEEKIKKLNEELEKRVTERTLEINKKSSELSDNQIALMNIVEDLNEKSELLKQNARLLEASNKELEAFSYSVSHDLRAPLRSIDGFSLALMEDYYKDLDENAKNFIHRIRNATMRMDNLIDSMLKLSRVTRYELRTEKVNLSGMVFEIAERLKTSQPDRNAEFNIQENVFALVDPYLLGIVMDNLLNNAWKYSSRKERTVIEFKTVMKDSKVIYCVKDNGSGFNMKYYNKLFGAFQRLHSSKDYPGTGIGLATSQRIIRRHGGEIWAESIENTETTFYFTLY
ncbi:MAG: PAS domain S-box protein [Ignavibacteriae bacterium]|nr:PAS domain S-box protein [Ignavibacteriota bacterium]